MKQEEKDLVKTLSSGHAWLQKIRSSMRIDARRFSIELVISSVLPFMILMLVLIIFRFLSSADILVVSIRLILGIIGLIFVPGFSVLRLLARNISLPEVFGFSLILGIGIQMISILSLFSVVTVFLYSQVDFPAIASWFITLFVFTCCIIRILRETRSNNPLQSATDVQTVRRRSGLFNLRNPLLVVFAAALVLRIWFQSLSLGPCTDGANYLEYARNIVQNGIFYSKAVEVGTPFELMFSKGFIPHVGASFALAIFFEMGGVSYFVGKITVVFFGAVLVFPVYGIAKELFNAKAGLVSSTIVAVHPFLVEYSSMLYGPEIMATIFLTSSFYFLLLSIRESQTWQAVFAGIFAFLTFIVWQTDFYVYLVVIPLVVLLRSREIRLGDIFLAFMLVGYWGFTSQFSANIPLGLTFHIGAPLLLLLVIFLKKSEKWTRSLCIFLLTISALLEFYWIRSFAFSEVFIAPASGVAAGTAIGDALGRFIPSEGILELLSNAILYVGVGYLRNLSPLIIVLGLASFIFIRTLGRKTLLLLLFPVSQIVLYTIFLSADTLQMLINWENRLLLATTPFIVILAAVFMNELMIWFGSLKRIGHVGSRKRIFSATASTFLVVIIVSPFFFASFYPQYAVVVDHIRGADIKTTYDLGQAVDWVNQNTAPNDIIATRKPYEWAWYTDRRCIMFDEGADLRDILALIKQYRVNYIIVDTLFYGSYRNLKNLYTNPQTPPAGFQLVFESHSSDGKKVLIYNTTSVVYANLWFETVTIENFDNLTGWIVAYGNLSLDNLSYVEGSASVTLETVRYPSPQDQFTANATKSIIFPSISNATNFNLWIKSNTTLQNRAFLQIFDNDSNWRLYLIYYSDVNLWKNVTIPIGFFVSQSLTPINENNIDRIVFWIQEMPMPSIVWFDQLSLTFIK